MLASALFLRTGVIAAVVGLGMGMAMGFAPDPALHAVHAHLNLVGWTSLFLFGLYYRVMPAAEGRLAQLHYVVAVCGLVLLIAGLAGRLLGAAEVFTPLALAGWLLTLASMAIFVWTVFSTTRSSRVGRSVEYDVPPGQRVLVEATQ
jgi:hypothetical protein